MRFCILSIVLLFASLPSFSSPRIIFSPDNPEVGEPVTFMIPCEWGILTLFDPGDGTTPIVTSIIENKIIYTYNTAGNFEPNYGCDGGTLQPAVEYHNSTGRVPFVAIAAAPALVPTLGEWGIIILALVLGCVGLVSLKKEQITSSYAN